MPTPLDALDDDLHRRALAVMMVHDISAKTLLRVATLAVCSMGLDDCEAAILRYEKWARRYHPVAHKEPLIEP